MISREIRNPLSAILHCSKDIDEAISDPRNVDVPTIEEAVETINVCIQVRLAIRCESETEADRVSCSHSTREASLMTCCLSQS
jgi:hypothetical protein